MENENCLVLAQIFKPSVKMIVRKKIDRSKKRIIGTETDGLKSCQSQRSSGSRHLGFNDSIPQQHKKKIP